jgi:carbon monoxide dehydrogenase subunit G
MERSIVINAQPAQVFTELNSFKNFNAWSPWAAIDPNTKYEYTGPETGVGAQMSWKSEHSDVGNGAQKIIESEENKRIKNEMTFEGFDEKAYGEFILVPKGTGTKVTWMYDGDMKGVSKVFGLLMDSFLGPVFEQDLAKLKDVVEKKAAEQPVTEVVSADSTVVVH